MSGLKRFLVIFISITLSFLLLRHMTSFLTLSGRQWLTNTYEGGNLPPINKSLQKKLEV